MTPVEPMFAFDYDAKGNPGQPIVMRWHGTNNVITRLTIGQMIDIKLQINALLSARGDRASTQNTCEHEFAVATSAGAFGVHVSCPTCGAKWTE